MKKIVFLIILFNLIVIFISCKINSDVIQNDAESVGITEDAQTTELIETAGNTDTEQNITAETNEAGLVIAVEQPGTVQTDTNAVGGYSSESSYSDVFNNSFHSFSYDLAKFVGVDKVDEWFHMDYVKTKEDPYFGQNIYEFIKYFNISKEDFSQIYYGTDTYYGSDYNVDLLYGGNEEAIYEYYRNGGNYENMEQRSFDQDIKISLTYSVDSDLYSKWKEDNNYEHFVSWSIPEFVYYFGISEEKLKEIVAVPNNLAKAEADGAPTITYEDGTVVSTQTAAYHDYNYDMIYNDNAEIKKMIADGTPGYLIDEMVHNS